MIRHAELTDAIAINTFGGKAEGLSRLAIVGAPVPPTLCLSVEKDDIASLDYVKDIESIISRWIPTIGLSADWIVRSSHLQEDSLETSSAGLYPSRVVSAGTRTFFLPIAQTISDIISILLRNSSKASVVLQPFISGDISGVIFSSDPNEGRCGRGILTYVNGPCSSLVDGTITPTTVHFSEEQFPASLPLSLSTCWNQLLGYCLRVEKQWEVPVDCEFTISKSGELYLLQARPISALTFLRLAPYLLEVDLKNRLPTSVESHPKVQLRFRCQRGGVSISPAWIATETKWLKLPRFNMPVGSYTSVLLHPHLLNGKVKRKFSSDGYSGAAAVLSEANNYWIRHAILTSLIQSSVTGIATSQAGKILIEVAKGHFIPKGLVDTTIYEIEGTDIRVIQQPIQRFYFDINPETGEPEKLDWNGKNSLHIDQLRAISKMVTKLNLEEGDCLEFGINDEGDTFVIDIQRGHSEENRLIANRTVVSLGEAEGNLLFISTPTSGGADDHFFEFASNSSHSDETMEPVVIAAIRPELGLLREFEKLAKLGKRVVGAIFEIYSPLSHLSVLLREWGIPTVVSPDFRNNLLSKARRVRVIASSEGGAVIRTDERNH